MESGDDSNEAMDVDESNATEGATLTNAGSLFTAYDPSSFSFLHLYRPQTDVVASLIHHSGMEGVDRYEISKRLGINAKTKAGNRTISNSIHTVVKTYPDNFGIFQKMEGRHRFLKYYAKSEQQTPAGGTALAEFSSRFHKLTGVECPYKLGESVKFPYHNLSTLRISDVTLKRLVRILEYVYREEVVITQSKLESQLSSLERKEGYAYQVDRKSLKKCVIALAQRNFLNTMKMEIDERGLSVSIEVIASPKIQRLDHPLVAKALKQIIFEFKEQNKSFPSGVRLKPEAKTFGNGHAKSDDEHREDELVAGTSAGTADLKQEDQEGSEIGGSLLSQTFNILHRKSLQKYSKKGGGTPISVLSQRSLNSLVDSAKQRRLTKPSKGTKKRRLLKEEREQIEDIGEDQSPIAKKLKGKERRVYDTLDTISLQHKAYLRSRFTQRERDMLLLIRACSFFLNPVSRFWPNPKVIRTLMHEYVPESRTKTTYSLMAAGVREVRSKERFAHHQYIVKTMASYKELLDLRNHLASLNFSERSKVDDQLQQKDLFFMNAFRASYQLMFRDAIDFPSVFVTDIELRRYLNSNNLYFLSTSDRQKFEVAQLKKKLSDESEIPHFVAYNTILFVLLSSTGLQTSKNKGGKLDEEYIGSAENNDGVEKVRMNEVDAETANFVVQQLDIQILADVLEKMRTGGLVTKKRCMEKKQPLSVRGTATDIGEESEMLNIDLSVRGCSPLDAEQPLAVNTESPQKLGPIQMGGEWRNELRCTQFYQHYFQPEYHRNLYESLSKEHSRAVVKRPSNNFGDTESPGQLLTLANYLCQNLNEFSVKTSMPNSIKELFCTTQRLTTCDDRIAGPENEGSDAFEQLTTSTAKQLRYLESTELRLELLKIRPELKHNYIDSIIQSLPNPEHLVTVQMVPQKEISEERRTKYIENSIGDNCCKKLLDLVDEAAVAGVSEEELKQQMCELYGFDAEMVQWNLNVLVESVDIITCGIDKVRFVSARNANPWLIRTREDSQGFVPKPWLLPSGQVNWKILRWMLEGLLSVVFNRSGLTEHELVSHFSPVMQPALTIELVQILSKLGCLSHCEKTLMEANKTDPFSRFAKTRSVRFVKTNIDGLERFVLFNEFKLKPFLESL